MNLIVTRHGQTDWNINNVLQGHTDVKLNETGIKQAEELAEKLKREKIDIIYTSPLDRAFSTAKIINKYHNVDIVIDEKIIERCFGEFEGTNGQAIDQNEYWNLDKNLSDSNIEPIKDLIKRTILFVNTLKGKYCNKDVTILIVTHNGVNLALSTIFNGRKENIFEYNMKSCETKFFKNIEKIEIGEKI